MVGIFPDLVIRKAISITTATEKHLVFFLCGKNTSGIMKLLRKIIQPKFQYQRA